MLRKIITHFSQRLLAYTNSDDVIGRVTRGAVTTGVMKISALLLSLVTSVILARLLGPEKLGQFTLIMAIISVLSIPVAPAMMQFVTRETAAMNSRKSLSGLWGLQRWSWRVSTFYFALVVFLSVPMAYPAINWNINDFWLAYLVALVALPVIACNAINAGLLAGLHRVVMAQIPEQLVRPVAQLLLIALLFIVGGLDVVSTVAVFVCAAVIAFVVSSYFVRRYTPGIADGALLAHGKSGWFIAWLPVALMVGASALNGQIGILLLGVFGTPQQVAAIQLADRGAQVVALSLAIINMVMAPHITAAWQERDLVRLKALWRYSSRSALLPAIPVALILIVFGAPIISFVYGSDYVEITSTSLAILSCGQLLNVAFGSVGMLLIMSGFERDVLYGQVVALMLNTVISMLLIPEYGASGAATASAVSLVAWNVLLFVQVIRRLKIMPSLL